MFFFISLNGEIFNTVQFRTILHVNLNITSSRLIEKLKHKYK